MRSPGSRAPHPPPAAARWLQVRDSVPCAGAGWTILQTRSVPWAGRGARPVARRRHGAPAGPTDRPARVVHAVGRDGRSSSPRARYTRPCVTRVARIAYAEDHHGPAAKIALTAHGLALTLAAGPVRCIIWTMLLGAPRSEGSARGHARAVRRRPRRVNPGVAHGRCRRPHSMRRSRQHSRSCWPRWENRQDRPPSSVPSMRQLASGTTRAPARALDPGRPKNGSGMPA